MKRIVFSIILTCLSTLLSLQAQTRIVDQPDIDKAFNILLATDLGRNGGYQQKPIAQLMGETAEAIDIEFVIASGDIHHYIGVESVNDPLWMTNYELIYSHPELQVEWYPVLGNHEYRGNTQAVIDYSHVSRRWCMPSRYYTQRHILKSGETIRLVYVDTPSLIDKYRNNPQTYPDAEKVDLSAQLEWIENTLSSSDETWKIVIGHHPIYADTSKSEDERQDLQERLDPILRKYGVDMYICGHIHNFQHIRSADSSIDYVVNSSGSLSRNVNPIDGTVFCNPEPGFSILSFISGKSILYMVNGKGEVIHTIRGTHQRQ